VQSIVSSRRENAHDRSNVVYAVVLRADGTVLSKRQTSWGSRFDSITLMPGDSIVVPEDYEHTTWMKSLRDYSQIFFQFALGAAAIKVLKN
jgi:hypothetical protein